ncbi:MAG: orotate phosphoribosyltransferase [Nitrospinae bacterium]|nr:orotate phosphoribosyltransferase [Nitrospinota bacterium]
MEKNARDRLLSMLARKSFMYSDAPVFRLASGKTSSYYVNCKKTAYDAEGVNLIGSVVFEAVSKHSPAGVGGLTLGADPIAVAVAGESYRRGSPIRAFVIRKQAKGHGTKSPVEGDLKAGERVVILEDVITTGESALAAINGAREFGLEVVAVVALVDRQEGGRERLEAERLPVEAVFTKDELLERYRKMMN